MERDKGIRRKINGCGERKRRTEFNRESESRERERREV